MNAKSFNLSTQGASHIKKNKECQDASVSYFDEKMAIAIVCDGHGGDDYMRSAVGSTLAAAVAKKNILNFLNTITKEQFLQNPEKNIKNLEASIISGWNEAIYTHFDQNPFSEAELSGVSEKAQKKYAQEGRIESAYGTTMIAVAMTSEFWFGIHIGDGKCVAVNPEGKFVQPIPWDSKCFLNATTSMCDSDALDRFRHFYSEKLPAAVFVGSDGIDDCFKNNEQLHNLYKTILYSFSTTDFEKAQEDLKDYLPRLSAKGSGDDVSIAAMLDFDIFPELDVVKEFDREKEKARVEENARIETEKNEAERKRIEEEHVRFQSRNKAKNSTAKFCTECGHKLISGMKFCGSCGAPVYGIKERELSEKKEADLQIIDVNQFSSEAGTQDLETQAQIQSPETKLDENLSDDATTELKDIKEETEVRDEIVTEATINDEKVVQADVSPEIEIPVQGDLEDQEVQIINEVTSEDNVEDVTQEM